jgi:hypothetical protein
MCQLIINLNLPLSTADTMYLYKVFQIGVLIAVLKPLAQFFWHRTFIIIVVQILFAIPLGHFFYLQITVANRLTLLVGYVILSA